MKQNLENILKEIEERKQKIVQEIAVLEKEQIALRREEYAVKADIYKRDNPNKEIKKLLICDRCGITILHGKHCPACSDEIRSERNKAFEKSFYK